MRIPEMYVIIRLLLLWVELNGYDHVVIIGWITIPHIWIIALCGYPHVKVSIRDLSQISTAAPIFQLYIYFRQNLEENVTFTFFFLVLPQISLVKYYETIKILMQIFVYFKLHFHNEGLDCQKNYFEMFFCDWPLLSSWKISALTVQPFTFFL